MSDSENNKAWKYTKDRCWKERCAKSWDDLVQIKNNDFIEEGKKFIFRGQGAHGDLKTSIERAFEEFEINGDARRTWEKRLIRSFQRKAPYYLKGISVPEPEDTLEWLSLMQHHEAPTRLLDWTYSFYRAIYNAVSKNTQKDKLWGRYDSELWVMNTRWFTNKTEGCTKKGEKNKEKKGILGKNIEKIRKTTKEQTLLDYLTKARNALDKSPEEEVEDYKGELANNRNILLQYLIDLKEPLSLVYNVTPIGLNERIIYQQGTFVLPGDITKCFMQNLEPYKKDNCEDHLYRIIIKLEQHERNRIIRELNDMNINEAVLFPGLDGFAKSLRMKLAFLDDKNTINFVG